MRSDPLKIVFMGTPDFAVPSLQVLIKAGYHISAVVTAPDKPAGRGRKLNESPVKKFGLENNLKVLQPEKLRDENFLNELRMLSADLFIVVAFRMLPSQVWKMPPLGTFNLHASLLPQYRGAAPINHAIINGEEKTGVTTFFINEEIDTGGILFRKEVKIEKHETAGELHDKLMIKGADLVLKTVRAIENKEIKPVRQDQLKETVDFLKPAPKIQKEDCQINWQGKTEDIYNFIRGLSPYPGAYTRIKSDTGESFLLKIFQSEIEHAPVNSIPGKIIVDKNSQLKISAADGFIILKQLQMEGRRRMEAVEFLRGVKNIEDYQAI